MSWNDLGYVKSSCVKGAYEDKHIWSNKNTVRDVVWGHTEGNTAVRSLGIKM